MVSIAQNLKEKIGQIIGGEYRILDLLGVGTFAAVYLAEHIPTLAPVAIKTLFKVGLHSDQLAIQYEEVALHRSISSLKHVVTLHKTLEDEDCLYLVLDYCSDDLYNFIQEESPEISDSEVKSIFLQAIGAVINLHKHGVYHRDLKPENLLLDQEFQVKVADFGLSTRSEFCSEVACGTRSYLPPETFNVALDGYHPGPADVWALGVILVNLRFQCKLWDSADPDEDSFYQQFLNLGGKTYFSRYFPDFSDELVNLLCKIFATNPQSRPTLQAIDEIIKDPSFKFIQDDADDVIVMSPTSPLAEQKHSREDSALGSSLKANQQTESPLGHCLKHFSSPSVESLTEQFERSGKWIDKVDEEPWNECDGFDPWCSHSEHITTSGDNLKSVAKKANAELNTSCASDFRNLSRAGLTSKIQVGGF